MTRLDKNIYLVISQSEKLAFLIEDGQVICMSRYGGPEPPGHGEAHGDRPGPDVVAKVRECGAVPNQG